jgi:hypothetical protein
MKFTLFSHDGPSVGMTVDSTNNHIIIGSSGYYHVVATFSSLGSNNTNYIWHLRKNAVELYPFAAETQLATAGPREASFSNIGYFESDSTVEVYVESSGSNNSLTTNQGQLVIVKMM